MRVQYMYMYMSCLYTEYFAESKQLPHMGRLATPSNRAQEDNGYA